LELNFDYEPLPGAKKFHASPSLHKLVVGGKGSGKTQGMLMEGIMLSLEYPHNIGLLARETMGELHEVVIDPLLRMIPDELIAEYRKADKKLVFTNGSIIYFRPLDESRKVKGLTLGWYGVDELDAVPEEMWLQLAGQNRQPGVRWARLGTTNPTTTEHWVYKRFVLDQLPDYETFRFPTRENKYLPDKFIQSLYETMPPSWVKRYLDGEWGAIETGVRVYPEFAEKIHLYDNLHYKPSVPVIRMWDFGIGSAVIFAQFYPPAGLDFIGEVFRKNLPSRQFAQMVSMYGEEHFPEAVFRDVGDIAGHHRESTSMRTPIQEINDELGINIKTNKPPLKASLDLVKVKLGMNIQGQAALRFHPERCKLLIDGLNGGYVWKRGRDGSVIRGVPAEDNIFEHLCDAMRYGVWDELKYKTPLSRRSKSNPKIDTQWEGTSW
jgi:hypothetical protein